METKKEQATNVILMVRPTTFGFDEQTAKTNTFQRHTQLNHAEVLRRANEEFSNAVEVLRHHGIQVIVFEDTAAAPKPNAVFPNNWLTMWHDGHVYLYPMATESRRNERSFAALEQLSRQFKITQVTDLSDTERSARYLESTGVMIFDHINQIVYGCISPRCEELLFVEHAQELGYEPIAFHAYAADGTAVYHTNVMMGIQSQTAVICAEAITDPHERELVVGRLKQTGRQVVEITQAQLHSFCGNVLELRNKTGGSFLVMSQSAHDNFTGEQREILSRGKQLLPLPIPTIETIGGGSARCMLAEVFLPNKYDLLTVTDVPGQAALIG